jgi:hypothetical protein
MTEVELIDTLHARGLETYELATAVLWWIGQGNPSLGMSAKQICIVLEAAGLPGQNSSRLNAKLAADRRITKAGKTGEWRLHLNLRRELDATYGDLIVPTRPIPKDTGSIIPLGLAKARGYLEKVVLQLNASYDAQLYDCCAVMCRRLLETLIIEVNEHYGRASEIKGTDGHFLMLNGLAGFLENDKAFNVSRSGLQGLRDFKKLGDLSAHSRRFNARKEDIDRVQNGLRVIVEELVHLAKLIP